MRGRRPRAMNPAFAAAHGIQSNEGGSSSDGDGIIINANNGGISNRSSSHSSSNSNGSLEIVLKRAQDTGKLVASNCAGLKVPLPKELFEFPFGLSRYTEDLLTVVDLSDNEEHFRDSLIDERILRYRSVQSLRFRNCGMRLPKKLSFSSFENLTILDLSGNRLDGRFDVGLLFWSPDKASALVELNLSNNQIREIVATTTTENIANNSGEPVVVSLPNLRSFNVSHNPSLERLFDEHESAFLCENLRIFRCHHNSNLQAPSSSAITVDDGLPSFLRSAKAALEVLEASHNPKIAIATSDGTTTRNIDIDLSGYEQLQTVSFALNKFERVPCIPHSVKTLDLRSNKLTSIKGMFSSHASSSAQLVDLILADNYLTELDPLVVETMAKLQRLDVTSNKIRALPYQLGFLTELSNLNISGNPVLTKFSFAVANSSNPKDLLETLRKRAPVQNETTAAGISTTGTTGIRSADSRASSMLLTGALSTKGRTTLDLAEKITEIGCDVALEGLIRELKSNIAIDRGITSQIILDSNRLESLPEDLLSSCLPNVQTISLTDNRFAELPTSLQASRSRVVKQLHLGKNLLTAEALERAFWFRPVASSPPSLSLHGWSLRSLTYLDLSSNKLTSFPIDTSSSVHCFPALEFLNHFNNKLTSLQNWKRLPESLTVLNLSENNIEDIELLTVLLAGGCPRFQRLSLMHNNVKRIPASLGLLSVYVPTMASLNLQGNPQRGIRPHVLEKPCGEFLEYLSNRLTAEQREATMEMIKHHKQDQQQEQEWQEPMHAVQEESTFQNPIVVPTPASDARGHQETSSPPMAIGKPKPAAPSNINISNNNSSNPIKDGSKGDGGNDEEEDHKLLKELQQSVEKLKADLDNLSLTQAKKYAVKKALAMERSKLIREERRLGLRK
jgi:Leucine-rich repeat (LRR) protein